VSPQHPNYKEELSLGALSEPPKDCVCSGLQGRTGSSLAAGYPPPLEGAAPGEEELQLPFRAEESKQGQTSANGGDAGADGTEADGGAVAGEVVDVGRDDAGAVNGEVADAFGDLRPGARQG
jgi:hypothetical protein